METVPAQVAELGNGASPEQVRLPHRGEQVRQWPQQPAELLRGFRVQAHGTLGRCTCQRRHAGDEVLEVRARACRQLCPAHHANEAQTLRMAQLRSRLLDSDRPRCHGGFMTPCLWQTKGRLLVYPASCWVGIDRRDGYKCISRHENVSQAWGQGSHGSAPPRLAG